MNLADLNLFVEVYLRGSFAAVARDRGIAPSSVSRSIASLENELGFALFDRTTRKLSPTEAGELYFERIEPLIYDLNRSRDLAHELTKTPSGTLRILAPVSFSQLNLVPLLPDFMRTYPKIRLDLRLTDALLDLVEHRIDIALRLGPLADSTYTTRKLAPMRSRICASPKYIEEYGKPKRAEDLLNHQCLLLDMPGFSNRWFFRDRLGKTCHVDVDGRLKTSNAIALKQCALAGVGIILQGEWIVGREVANGSLIDIFPNHEVTSSSFDNAVWSLRPARSHEAGKIRVFLEFLHETFRKCPPWQEQTG